MIQDTRYLVENFKTSPLELTQIDYRSNQPFDWIDKHQMHSVKHNLEIGVTAKNTELWITKQQQQCIVVIGESWTYGDRLYDADGGIQVYSIDKEDNLSFRLNNIFAGHCARLTRSDLYLCAVPGCNNTELVFHLPDVLHFLHKKYKNIKVVFQITSPGRCFSSPKWNNITEYYKNYMGTTMGMFGDKTKKLSLTQWFATYEQQLIDLISGFCNQYSADFLIWRNFNPIMNTNNRSIIPQSWVEYLAKLFDQNITFPLCNEVEWWDKWTSKIINLNTTKNEINQQLDCIEKFCNFLDHVPLCEWHPQITAHWLWTKKILNHSKWIQI